MNNVMPISIKHLNIFTDWIESGFIPIPVIISSNRVLSLLSYDIPWTINGSKNSLVVIWITAFLPVFNCKIETHSASKVTKTRKFNILALAAN